MLWMWWQTEGWKEKCPSTCGADPVPSTIEIFSSGLVLGLAVCLFRARLPGTRYLGLYRVLSFFQGIFIIIIPIAALYYFVQRVYIAATTRQVKRMECVTRSPIYTHFSERISGASTIRAFTRTRTKNEERIETNQICYYLGYVRLKIIGNMVPMFAILFAVLSRGNFGLALSYALNVTDRWGQHLPPRHPGGERIGARDQRHCQGLKPGGLHHK